MTTDVPTILVVDDDPRSLRLLQGFLVGEGYDVHVAADGPEALNSAQADPPDLVLLDVMMPGMTGYQVCAELKQRPETQLTQVMLVTALDSTGDRVAGLDGGADDFLSKPVRREELMAKVRSLLRVRRAMVELEEARDELARRNEELELKRTLAQTLVHDLKNPLAAVLGNLDLLERRADPLLGAVVQRTREGATRMLKMVVNLLDIERLEEGRLEPSIERFDLARLAADTVREADGAARPRQVRIECDADEPAWAEFDASLIRRVLENLISNAVRHTPPDGRVRIAVEARDGAIEMSVSDQGPGVPEPYRERIFEKYAQLDVRRSGGPSNLGLGLTFCRLAVEAHGGTVWVDDAPDGGASFHAVLPADVTPATRSDADLAISA